MCTPKVSVVIPCYNVEKYLRQCLDSVVHQTLKELEIICVNDGSTDSTLAIIQEYAAEDPRIRIIDKPNSGYGESMNQGFDLATGEYIGIIESDDFAELDMFENLYTCAKQHQLDVAKSGWFDYWSTPEERNVPRRVTTPARADRTFCPVEDVVSKTEMQSIFNVQSTIWSAIYRRSFIRESNIRFIESPGASYQDASFNFKIWALAKRVRVLEACYLHYRKDNPGSSVHNTGKMYCICDEYDEMERFLNANPSLKAPLEPVMVRVKFGSYHWNYRRLTQPLQREFIQRFSTDFRRHLEDGTLQEMYFNPYNWVVVNQIIENPLAYHKVQEGIQAGFLPRDYLSKGKPRRKIGNITVPHFLDQVLGVFACIQENGIRYTVKYSIQKALWVIKN